MHLALRCAPSIWMRPFLLLLRRFPRQGACHPSLRAKRILVVINAPALWQLGFQGQGVVVANMDSGVSVSHPDLAAQWRGGTNSWFDPYGEHPTSPSDLTGHGTATMGVMVGRDAGGTNIGVAPLAQWIAVKIFDDQGQATATAIHLGFQWLLDPDGDPSTPDAPQVVNNSWSIGNTDCDLAFQLDLQALRAADIVPVFSAGNTGPGDATSVSPANNPEAFAVGATDNVDQIYIDSARGPSACGEPATFYPEMVAPGVEIRTTDLCGTYLDRQRHLFGRSPRRRSAGPAVECNPESDGRPTGGCLAQGGRRSRFARTRQYLWAGPARRAGCLRLADRVYPAVHHQTGRSRPG